MNTIKALYQNPKQRVWLIAAFGIALAIAMGVVTFVIQKTYFEHNSYFLDVASYQFYNARLYVRLATNSPLSLAADELVNNGRSPLRTIPLLLFAPSLLAQPLGHMALSVPMFAVFLVILGLSVHKRTNNVAYSLATMLLFCAIPVMVSTKLGIATYWLDVHTSFLVGAAALALFNSDRTKNRAWLVTFALLASLATLSRWPAAGYILVMCAPVYVAFVLARWREEKSYVRAALVPTLLVSAIIAVLAGYFLLAHSAENLQFYTSEGEDLFHGVSSSAIWVTSMILRYFTIPFAIGLAVLFVINLFVLGDEPRKWDWLGLGALIWFTLSQPLLQIFVLRITNQIHTPLYVVPPLFMLVVAPVRWREKIPNVWRYTVPAVVVLVAAVFLTREGITQYRQAKYPNTNTLALKELDETLAKNMAAQGQNLTWKVFYDVADTKLALEVFYNYGWLMLQPSESHDKKTLFSLYDVDWDAGYPNESPQDAGKQVYQQVSQWVDGIVVFDNPADADANIDDSYAASVAQYLSQQVKDNPQWKRVFVVDSKLYGHLAGYRNTNAAPGTYDALLKQNGSTLP